MSNIGKQYIQIPQGVNITLNNNNYVIIKGNKGVLEKKLPEDVLLIQQNSKIYFLPYNSLNSIKKYDKTKWGTVRTIIKNMIKGVHQEFNVKLQLVGIGYKVQLENNILSFKLGYSHIIHYEIPPHIKIQILKPTLISIQGIDHEFVTKIAAEIRSFRKPEPYKGKGIRYINEKIIKKEGKKK
jgi:large subunit ribosomal protein L6